MKKYKILILKCRKKVGREAINKYKNLQLIDARFIYGEEHIKKAIKEAEKAFRNKENIANNFFVEVLLRASAQRSITKAFELFGVNNSDEVVLIGNSISEIKKFIKEYCAKEFRINLGGKKMRELTRVFRIGKEELNLGKDKKEIIKKIINEKIALMNIL